MEQRPLRLGDIVDDYCPRERRITNHAIVALVEDAIRQTRCTTCDAEHVYKHGKAPVRRRKDASSTEAPPGTLIAARPQTPPTAPDEAPVAAAAPVADADAPQPAAMVAAANGADTHAADAHPTAEPHGPDDGWLAHRQLIRATLPRDAGEPPAPRPIPEFTMYQRPQGRGKQPFRFGQGRNGNVAGRDPFPNGNGNGNGNGNAHRNGNRAPAGNGAGRPGRRRGHNRRSR